MMVVPPAGRPAAPPEVAGPAAISQVTPLTQVDKVVNDARLSSRAALQQQLGVGLAASGDSSRSSSQAAPAAASADAVTLSAAARTVSGLLDFPAAPASKIMGTQALWPDSQPAPAPQLAAALARTVETSGLFYESHLLQLAAGTRPLAQLVLEPQAQLPPGGGRAAGADDSAAPAQDLAGAQPADKTASAPEAARCTPPVPAAIHPEAVALVRQQLELLAQPAFRWAGEAWPGTPMDWEIHEEPDGRPAAAEGEAAPRRWQTRLALSLPTLKDVEVRLRLVGNTLEVRLAASEHATVAQLRQGRDELPERMGMLGLQLGMVQVGALAAPGRPEDPAP